MTSVSLLVLVFVLFTLLSVWLLVWFALVWFALHLLLLFTSRAQWNSVKLMKSYALIIKMAKRYIEVHILWWEVIISHQIDRHTHFHYHPRLKANKCEWIFTEFFHFSLSLSLCAHKTHFGDLILHWMEKREENCCGLQQIVFENKKKMIWFRAAAQTMLFIHSCSILLNCDGFVFGLFTTLSASALSAAHLQINKRNKTNSNECKVFTGGCCGCTFFISIRSISFMCFHFISSVFFEWKKGEQNFNCSA